MHAAIKETLALICAEQRAAGERVQPAASAKAIQALRTHARDNLSAALSGSFAEILSNVDGLDFNGTVLYATASRELPGSGVLLGFREANALFRQGGERHHVLYGETGDELFAQDQRSSTWCILDRGSLSELERFPDDDALMEHVLQRAYETRVLSRLSAHDRLSPGPAA